VPDFCTRENAKEFGSGARLAAAICRASTPCCRGGVSKIVVQHTGLHVHKNVGFFRVRFSGTYRCASFQIVEVVLRKVGRKSGRAVVGRLLRPPRKGSVVVIEFADGLHEYVTTPVKRVLQLCGQDTYYLQTANSRYRLEVRSSESGIVDQPVAN